MYICVLWEWQVHVTDASCVVVSPGRLILKLKTIVVILVTVLLMLETGNY